MLILFVYLFAASVDCLSSKEGFQCPTRCKCEHVEGRLTADCSKANLSSLPSGAVPRGTMVLVLDGSSLDELNVARYFARPDFADLLELSLKNCKISKFKAHAFWGLSNLNKLVLARNSIKDIPFELVKNSERIGPFNDMANLKKLDLSHNQIVKLMSKMFRGAGHLEEIDLSFNGINFIMDDVFTDMVHLRSIFLQSNHLYRVFPEPFSKLTSLKVLNLLDNPFDCDCMQRDFVKWQLNKYLTEPPTCHLPTRLEGKRWDQLKLDEFACIPSVEIVESKNGGKSNHKVVKLGGQAKFECSVKGDPKPEVRWQFHRGGGSMPIDSNATKKYLIESKQNILSPNTWFHNLTVFLVDVSNVGGYHCLAKNQAGSEYVVFQLELEKSAEKNDENAKAILKATESGDLWFFVVLIVAAALLLIVILILLVYCYLRARQRRQGTPVYKSVNGYGYHIIDGAAGGPGTAPSGGPNPLEKPPRTHVENIYSTAPVNMYGGDLGADEKGEAAASVLCPRHNGVFGQGGVHSSPMAPDDSGFVDPEMQLNSAYSSSTLPRAKRILKPAADETVFSNKKSLSPIVQRRNSLPEGQAPLASREDDENKLVLRETAL